MSETAEKADKYAEARRRNREALARRPIFKSYKEGEWEAELGDLPPATEDDVPFSFPVKVPLRQGPAV